MYWLRTRVFGHRHRSARPGDRSSSPVHRTTAAFRMARGHAPPARAHADFFPQGPGHSARSSVEVHVCQLSQGEEPSRRLHEPRDLPSLARGVQRLHVLVRFAFRAGCTVRPRSGWCVADRGPRGANPVVAGAFEKRRDGRNEHRDCEECGCCDRREAQDTAGTFDRRSRLQDRPLFVVLNRRPEDLGRYTQGIQCGCNRRRPKCGRDLQRFAEPVSKVLHNTLHGSVCAQTQR